ncbi:MAG: hypothetical protein HQK54_08110 [Oligoflexales bacterium]|nr:hypothetical protein [Oligoflexales bacterium]
MQIALSEGAADVTAAYFSESSVIGKGLFLRDGSRTIRNLSNSRRLGDSGSNEPHSAGEIISGAFWDLRETLIARYGKTKGKFIASDLFFRHIKSTSAIADSYNKVLLLDDEDNNTSTRSPNHCLINKAFAKHNLAQDENCTDPAYANKIPVDDNLNIGIYKKEGPKTFIMASTLLGASGTICIGNRKYCEDKNRPSGSDIILKKEGIKNGRMFFVSEQGIDISNFMDITVFVKSVTGDITGAREFRFASK